MPTQINIPGEPNITLEDVGGSVLDFAQKQEVPIDEAYQQYVMTQRAQEKPLDVFTKLEEQAGLPGMRKTATTLREQVGGLEDTIKRVAKNVAARSSQSLVTEAQRQGMVTAEKSPLLERLGELSTGLGRVEQGIQAAGSDISQKTGLVLQGQQMELEPLKMRMDLLSDRAARLTSGFTADSQSRLNILMDKLNRQRQLTDIEREEAFRLKLAEDDYNREKEKYQAQNKAQIEYLAISSAQDLSDYEKKKLIDQKFKSSSDGSIKVGTTVTPTSRYSIVTPSSTPDLSSFYKYDSTSPVAGASATIRR